nr:UDP-2,3-diacylglucosamine diphosphatase LpxI [Salinihabitans flavidus]
MVGLAILSGSGGLPQRLAEARPDALRVVFRGEKHDHSGSVFEHDFNRLGDLFDFLIEHEIGQVVLAGAVSRPSLDPAQFDPYMVRVAPRLIAAMRTGDDALLREVIALFEEQDLEVVGAHELLPDLTVPEGVIFGTLPSDQNRIDAARALDILEALSPLDVGQGAVVARGLCLGVETLQGTDALLRFVADTPTEVHPGGGVLAKAPKIGQDLRADMPAIGPATVRNAAAARLDGIVIGAGTVLVLERDSIMQALDETGLFLFAERCR